MACLLSNPAWGCVAGEWPSVSLASSSLPPYLKVVGSGSSRMKGNCLEAGRMELRIHAIWAQWIHSPGVLVCKTEYILYPMFTFSPVVEIRRQFLLDRLVQLLVVLGDHGLLAHLVQDPRPGL